MNLIGLNSLEYKEKIEKFLEDYRNQKVNFIIDNDAHDIEGVRENYFWIKGSKRNFSMLKEAIDDFDISVVFENSKTCEKYIEGIYVEQGGFLKDKNDEAEFILKLEMIIYLRY